jgi:hypothetical protein
MKNRLAVQLGWIAAFTSVAVIAGCTTQTGSPTPAYQTIDLVATDADNRYPVSVQVVDESHRLADARSSSPSELSAQLQQRPMEGAAIAVTRVDGSDTFVLLIWNGTGCDRNASVLVGRDVTTLTVDAGAPATCSLPGTYRSIVLMFVSPVVVEEIRLEAT